MIFKDTSQKKRKRNRNNYQVYKNMFNSLEHRLILIKATYHSQWLSSIKEVAEVVRMCAKISIDFCHECQVLLNFRYQY